MNNHIPTQLQETINHLHTLKTVHNYMNEINAAIAGAEHALTQRSFSYEGEEENTQQLLKNLKLALDTALTYLAANGWLATHDAALAHKAMLHVDEIYQAKAAVNNFIPEWLGNQEDNEEFVNSTYQYIEQQSGI